PESAEDFCGRPHPFSLKNDNGTGQSPFLHSVSSALASIVSLNVLSGEAALRLPARLRIPVSARQAASDRTSRRCVASVQPDATAGLTATIRVTRSGKSPWRPEPCGT